MPAKGTKKPQYTQPAPAPDATPPAAPIKVAPIRKTRKR